jgi:DedD protein
MGETQDTEITLGTGKLLGIFFGLVAVCSLFFIMGYVLGKNTASGTAGTTIIGGVPTASGNPANKPSAGGKTPDTTVANPGSNGPGSSVYSAVTSKQPDNQLPAQASGSVPTFDVSKNPETGNATSTTAPEVKNNASGSYMVQVAAVSRQEDAEILVSALRKKQYPVFVANVPGDDLFHVQVGPFTDPKDAESMRSRLAGDGYNAIVKR